jgi:hypothetical protein
LSTAPSGIGRKRGLKENSLKSEESGLVENKLYEVALLLEKGIEMLQVAKTNL